jgi:DNA-binding NarL/FixJ family response regulator
MTLFIAETNDRVRQRLASIAASVEGITVVGEAGDVGDAVGGINRAKPDSVIVAIPMSGGSGLEVLSAAKTSNPASIAIMLSLGPCSECEHKCFSMGADYFFEKSGELKKIVTTLVLLAHNDDQHGVAQTGNQQESTGRPTPNSSQAPQLPFSGLVPVACPRLVTSRAAKSKSCFLVAGAPRTSSSSAVPLTG